MIKKLKLSAALCILGFGLSGCIVVPDDEVSYYSYSSYSPYPVGSYELATDYYHRPPAPKVHHYKHHKSDYKHKKHEHEKHIDKHHIDKKHIDKKHEDKHHVDKKHEHEKHIDKHHVDNKHDNNAKPHHETPKNVIHQEKPLPGSLTQNKNSHSDKKKVGRIEQKPISAHKAFPRH